MKYLVDNQLSPAIAEGLRNAGYDDVHVRDYQMQQALDSAIFARAAAEDRIVVAADTDFGTLLAQHNTRKPSVILLRVPLLRRPAEQLAVLLNNIPPVEAELNEGAIVVIEAARVRVRMLPIHRNDD